MKLLVVDDDAEMLRMLTRVFGSRGHQVETCHGPFGASALALREKPDVILLDLHMPGLGGDSLSAVLGKVELTPRPQVVLWSAAEPEELLRVAQSTRLPTLSKRFHIHSIVDELERIYAARA
jgi:CheY-like chemotaxis protein